MAFFNFLRLLMKSDVSILIVDDHSAIRLAVKYILSSEGFTKIMEAENGIDAINLSNVNKYDVAILDLDLPKIDGLKVVRRMKAKNADLKILVLSSMASDVYLTRCYAAGVNGFMRKDDDIDTLPSIIINLLKGFSYFPGMNNKDRLRKIRPVDEMLTCLSDRELTVFNGLIMGKSNLTIADELCLSNKTVSTYKRRIFDKLGVSNIAQLIDFHKTL
ncbi:response regulator [Aeromonas veronii]|uniref:response regulator n=1 Tax=Aeromonas veronii TaxID=654 RepID=UPI001D04CD3B